MQSSLPTVHLHARSTARNNATSHALSRAYPPFGNQAKIRPILSDLEHYFALVNFESQP